MGHVRISFWSILKDCGLALVSAVAVALAGWLGTVLVRWCCGRPSGPAAGQRGGNLHLHLHPVADPGHRHSFQWRLQPVGGGWSPPVDPPTASTRTATGVTIRTRTTCACQGISIPHQNASASCTTGTAAGSHRSSSRRIAMAGDSDASSSAGPAPTTVSAAPGGSRSKNKPVAGPHDDDDVRCVCVHPIPSHPIPSRRCSCVFA